MPNDETWTWPEAVETAEASTYSAPPMYSADYLRVTQSAAPPVVYVGFGADGEPAYILRSQGGRELTRVAATKENAADERPRGFFASLARLMYGGQRR
jgi:hypothetical protein